MRTFFPRIFEVFEIPTILAWEGLRDLFWLQFSSYRWVKCRFAWEWIENSQACWLGVSNFWCHLLRIHLLTVSCSLVAKFQPNLPSSSKLADSTNSLVQMTAPWLSCSVQDQVRPDLSSTLVSTAEVFTTPHFSCSHALLVCTIVARMREIYVFWPLFWLRHLKP